MTPMAPKLHALTVSATDPEDLAVFWASLLGWERDGLDVVPGEAMPLRLAFAATDLQRTGLNQMHLHLTSNTTSRTRPSRVCSLWAAPTSTSGSCRRRTTSWWRIRAATSSA